MSEQPAPSLALDVHVTPAAPAIPSTAAPVVQKPQTIEMSGRGLQLTNMDEAWRFAAAVVRSGLAPRGIETQEKVFIAVQMGMELGLPPMAALQNIAVINGRPSLWGDAVLGLVQSSGNCESYSEESIGTMGEDDFGFTAKAKRRDNGSTFSNTFTVAHAKRAGLWGKQGPWTQYPDRMLKMRARSFTVRDAFPDVLRGVGVAEEVRDTTQDPRNVTGSMAAELTGGAK